MKTYIHVIVNSCKWEFVVTTQPESVCVVHGVAGGVFSDNSITVETAARYSATNAPTWRWCCRRRRSLSASVTRATPCCSSAAPPTELTLHSSPGVSSYQPGTVLWQTAVDRCSASGNIVAVTFCEHLLHTPRKAVLASAVRISKCFWIHIPCRY